MTLLSWKSPKLTARTIAMAAILIAMQIVLSKLSIGPDNLVKFSFGFIATMLMGYYLGPWLTGVAMAISDILTNSVFSTGGNFFIGFTFSAIISGIIALKVKPIKKLPPVEKTLLVRISLIAIATPVNHGPK